MINYNISAVFLHFLFLRKITYSKKWGNSKKIFILPKPKNLCYNNFIIVFFVVITALLRKFVPALPRKLHLLLRKLNIFTKAVQK